MKKITFKNFLFTLVFLFSVTSIAQNGKNLWTKTSKSNASKGEKAFRKTEPKKADFYQLDITSLKAALVNAPNRKTTQKSNFILSFPTAGNKFESFRVTEASVMAPELEAKFPGIHSYAGQSIENPSTLIRFSVTSQGLHLMMLSTEKGTQFIDPYTKNGNDYVVYAKRDLPKLDQPWKCGVIEDDMNIDEKSLGDSYELRNTGDGMMRDFRLAIATTVEYSQFHWLAAGLTAGDTVAARKAAVMAAIVVTVTRNNFVYERDFSLTMTLVANNDAVVHITSHPYSDPDPVTPGNQADGDANTLINENTGVISSAIGSGSYDVGHVFSTGGGGLAALGSPCSGFKGAGVTGSPAPVGDPYDIDFVAHELGHQFGAPHSFNGTQGNCTTGTASNAYEVGSGTTIMAYAGICGSDNVQANSDAYFHQKSLQMIWSNITTGSSTCANQLPTGNSAPTAEAGNNFIIPMSTPYMLTGSSTDPDGVPAEAAHTYTWEQYDLGPAGLPADGNLTGPLVRSFEGTTSPTRYVPRMQDIVANGGMSTTWEKLSSVDRDINFQLTVRDNDANGGRTANDNMIVDVESTAGPFTVTSQSAATTWSQGNLETITWNRANTHTGTVNTPNVDILLSTDGGLTYPIVLATAVPNDGSHDIVVPTVTSDDCRVMVKGNGNIFFNINTARIGIGFNFVAGDVCTDYSLSTNVTLTPNAGGFEFLSTINVPDSGTITDINMKISMTTADLDNVHFLIEDPTQAQATYPFAGSCAGSSNIDVTWDDEAGAAVVCGSPVTGSATPRAGQELTVFDGLEMNGNWIVWGANTGTVNTVLDAIDLTICKLGSVPAPSPNRINQSVIQVATLGSVIATNTHVEVTSPNTALASDVVYTLTVLPNKGTLFLNAAPLAMSGTFTQDDVNTGKVSYTTTSAVNNTDFFRVDVSDSNTGTLPNLRVDINIDSVLGITENQFDNSFNVYPNPSNGEVTISLATKEDVKTSLFDIRGRNVYSELHTNNSDVFSAKLEFNSLASGVYMLEVQSGSNRAVKKIVIQ